MSDRRRLIASALRYSVTDSAPRVIAHGEGAVAQKIIDLAAAHNIDIVENDALAESLRMLDIEQEIPERLYLIVAEILAVIFNK